MPPTGVITPMFSEYRSARALRARGWRVWHAGMGAERARTAAERLLTGGARGLLVWGVAGALVAELRPGALVVPETVTDINGGHWPVAADWRAQLTQALAKDSTMPAAGALVSVDTPVADPEDKRSLARASGAVVVDLETAAVGAVAAAHGVPFAVLRVVADPLELALPRVVLAARTDRLLGAEIALRLCVRPRDARAVAALAWAFCPARAALHRAAAVLANAPTV